MAVRKELVDLIIKFKTEGKGDLQDVTERINALFGKGKEIAAQFKGADLVPTDKIDQITRVRDEIASLAEVLRSLARAAAEGKDLEQAFAYTEQAQGLEKIVRSLSSASASIENYNTGLAEAQTKNQAFGFSTQQVATAFDVFGDALLKANPEQFIKMIVDANLGSRNLTQNFTEMAASARGSAEEFREFGDLLTADKLDAAAKAFEKINVQLNPTAKDLEKINLVGKEFGFTAQQIATATEKYGASLAKAPLGDYARKVVEANAGIQGQAVDLDKLTSELHEQVNAYAALDKVDSSKKTEKYRAALTGLNKEMANARNLLTGLTDANAKFGFTEEWVVNAVRKFGQEILTANPREFASAIVEANADLVGFREQLDEVIESLQKARLAQGGVNRVFTDMSRTRLGDTLAGVRDQAYQTNRETASLGDTLSNLKKHASAPLESLDKLGFRLFLITQNVKTVQNLLKGLYATLQSAGSRIDVAREYNSMLAQSGVNTREYTRTLQEASDGLILFTQIQKSTNQAMNAGAEVVIENQAQLINLAKGASIASGTLDEADQNYERLIDSIVRANPAQLRALTIAEDFESAYRNLADSLGIAVEDLTNQQKAAALAENIIEMNQELIETGENAESVAGEFVLIKNSITEATQSVSDLSAALTARLIGRFTRLASSGGLLYTMIFGEGPSFKERIAAGLKGTIALILRFGQGLSVISLGLLGVLRLHGQMFSFIKESLAFLLTSLAEGATIAQNLATIISDPFDAKAVKNAVQNITQATTEVSDDWTKIASEHTATILEITRQTADGINGALEASENDIEEWGNLIDEVFLGITEGAESAIDPLTRLRNALSDLANDSELMSNLNRFEEFFKSDEFKLQQDLLDALEDFQKDYKEIQLKGQEDIIKEKNDFLDRLRDLERDYQRDLIDLNTDIQRDLADLQGDTGKEIEDENKKHKKKLEDIEENHQKNIDKILRRFELSRLKALIDRDARALFEAQRKRDEDLHDAAQNHADSISQQNEAHQEELNEIKENEEEKRKEILLAAERRREDLALELKRQQDDLEDALKEKIKEIKKSLKEELKEREKAFKDEQKELKEHYEQEGLIAKLGLIKLRLEEAQSQLEQEGDLGAFLDRLEILWGDYYDTIYQLADDFELPPIDPPDLPPITWPPTGGGGDTGGTGTGGGGDSDPCVDGPGGPCSGNGYVTCPDGTVYVCTSGYWFTWGGQGRGAGAGSGSGSRGFGSSGAAAGNGSRVPVTISVENDNTLEQIFKEITYSAFMEILE